MRTLYEETLHFNELTRSKYLIKCLFNCKWRPASQSAPAPDEVLATSIGTYENRTLLVPDGRLALTALHKGKDYQGKPMFYVLFELTNTTEKHKIFS